MGLVGLGVMMVAVVAREVVREVEVIQEGRGGCPVMRPASRAPSRHLSL